MTDGRPFLRIERYLDILSEHGMEPFERVPWINPRTGKVEPRVLGERPAMRWRVSTDEWYRLEAVVRGVYGWASRSVDTSTLYGFPIESDGSLPPNSVIFEPDAADKLGEALG